MPAHHLHVDLRAVRAPAGVRWRRLSVSVTAGAVGEVDGQPAAGVALRRWSPAFDRWDTQAEDAAGLDDSGSPWLGDLVWQTDDPEAIEDVVARFDRTEDLVVLPRAASGGGRGRLEVDYAELRLRYEVP